MNQKTVEIYNDVRQIIGDRDMLTNYNIKNVITKSYTYIREDESIIDDLFHIIYDLITHIDCNAESSDDPLYNRLLSLVALKNDAMIQKHMDERYIDLYLYEVEYVISRKAYINGSKFTAPKIGECLAKIQHAYRLVESSKNIRPIFTKFMTEVVESGVYKDIIWDLNNFVHIDGDSPAMLYSYYSMFRDVEDIKEMMDQNISSYLMIMMFWKRHRIGHYKMTIDEIYKEGFNDYKFVY